MYRFGPVDTLDQDSIKRHRDVLVTEVERLRNADLHGDDHCYRCEYIEWATPKITWLGQLLNAVKKRTP